MRLIVTIIIFVHALVHLYGFVNERFLIDATHMRWSKIIRVSGRTTRLLGTLWLTTCMIFSLSAVGLIIEADWWRIVAGVGVVLSQSLIIIYIKHAWPSTFGNICIILAIIWLK